MEKLDKDILKLATTISEMEKNLNEAKALLRHLISIKDGRKNGQPSLEDMLRELQELAKHL